MQRLYGLITVIMILTSGFLFAQEPVKAAEKYPISVLPIEYSGETAIDYNTMVAEQFIVEQIIRIPIYKIIERSKLNNILQEQKLQLTGLVSDETIVKIGALIGAKFLLQPTIIKVEDTIEGTPGNETFSSNLIRATVSIHIFDTESGEIIFSSTGKGRSRAPQEASASSISAVKSAFNMCIYDLIEYVNYKHSLNLENFITRPKKKNPSTAVSLSLIPGVGQFYAENPEGGKDTIIMTVAAAGSIFIVNHDNDWIRTCGWLVIGTAVYTYITSFWDAHHSANKYNIEMGLITCGNNRENDYCDLYNFKLGIVMKF